VGTWRELDLASEARDTLDATLVDATGKPDLWRARLAFAEDADAARAVIDRWALAMPASLLPLEALLSLQQGIGDPAGAVITAERLVSLQPGHVDGRLQIVDGLMAQDPARAIDRLQSWLQSAVEPADRSFLLGMLGLGQDHLGNHDQAVETWSKMHAEIASLRLPLPPLGTPRAEWPELAQHAPGAPQIAFLVGAPGSAVERLAAVMESIGGPFRADRFGLFAPQDDFQSYSLIEGLRSGRIGGEEVIARWRQALPSRRLGTADIIDWLPWWDNALLIALRPHLPEAMLIFAVRDPRDMLLEWMAFGSVSRFQFPSPQKAAEWLANALGQLAALSENDWFPHHIIRTDAVGNDAQAAAARVSEVLATQVPVPASVGPAHFTAGHWRDYSKVMEAPFALLAPVAKRLGYPEN
ncbi:MAG: adenylate cyclase, partial [Pseudoxanthomonas sp.]